MEIRDQSELMPNVEGTRGMVGSLWSRSTLSVLRFHLFLTRSIEFSNSFNSTHLQVIIHSIIMLSKNNAPDERTGSELVTAEIMKKFRLTRKTKAARKRKEWEKMMNNNHAVRTITVSLKTDAYTGCSVAANALIRRAHVDLCWTS